MAFFNKASFVSILIAGLFAYGHGVSAADVACGKCVGASNDAAQCRTFINTCLKTQGGMLDANDTCIVPEGKCGTNQCPGDLVRTPGGDCVMTVTGGGNTQPPSVPTGGTKPSGDTQPPSTPAGGTQSPLPPTTPSAPKPATQPSACGAGTTYSCITCGVTPSQLPCVVSAGCNQGTTGACVPNTSTSNPANSNGGNTNCSGDKLCNPLKVDSVDGLVLAIIDVVLIFLLPVIILYIMYAGFLFVKANGNPEGISQAKKALLTALIGGVIVVGARAILDVVKGTIESVTGTELSTTAGAGSTNTTNTGNGNTGSAGGGSGSGSGGTDATFSNYAVGTWTGDGVGKVQTRTDMPSAYNPAFTLACSACYGNIDKCLGRNLPVGDEGFPAQSTRYRGYSTFLTANGSLPVKYACWLNPAVTPTCPSGMKSYSYQ